MEFGLSLLTTFVAIFSALMVVFHRNPMVNIVFLILNLGCIAVFFLLLGGQFIAAIQVIVYAGAIMVLFLFVIMLLNLRREEGLQLGGRFQRYLYVPFALAFAVALISAMRKQALTRAAAPQAGFGSVEAIGKLLFTEHLFAFELASLLLLVGMIGAVLLAKRKLE